jgi:hypothetical protein
MAKTKFKVLCEFVSYRGMLYAPGETFEAKEARRARVASGGVVEEVKSPSKRTRKRASTE